MFEEASAWFARLRADDAGAGDRERFDRWLAASPRHSATWREVQDLFAALEEPARSIRARKSTHEADATAPTPAPRRRVGYAQAAAFAVLAFILVALWPADWIENLRSDFHTAAGLQQSITLADGSQLLLNTDTAVTVDMTAEERRVQLLRGEAFFEVEHAPERPFWVEAGDTRVRVTGTAFSVGRTDDRVTVTVAEGRVETSGEGSASPPVVLTAGQSMRYLGNRPEAVQTVDLNKELAWRNGRLIFVQAPLFRVVEEINRYRPGSIVITNAAARDRPVTAVFSIHRLDDAIAALEQTLGLHARRFTSYLILLG